MNFLKHILALQHTLEHVTAGSWSIWTEKNMRNVHGIKVSRVFPPLLSINIIWPAAKFLIVELLGSKIQYSKEWSTSKSARTVQFEFELFSVFLFVFGSKCSKIEINVGEPFSLSSIIWIRVQFSSVHKVRNCFFVRSDWIKFKSKLSRKEHGQLSADS